MPPFSPRPPSVGVCPGAALAACAAAGGRAAPFRRCTLHACLPAGAELRLAVASRRFLTCKSIVHSCSPPGAQALEALEGEVGVQAGDLEAKYKGLLEKKWTSVVRLQKKVWRRP